LYSRLSLVPDGWFDPPGPNGTQSAEWDCLPISLMFFDICQSIRPPPFFCQDRPSSVMLNDGYAVFQTLVVGSRSYSKLPK
jgi:hypothetical protein